MKKSNKFFLFTLGCQMNISDSQRIRHKLEELDYQAAPKEKGADLLIINACSVRQKAVDRIWGKINNWQKYPGKKILITGCILPADKKKLKQKKVEIFPIKELSKLKEIIYKLPSGKSIDYFKILPKQNGKTAYIPIMTGCDNYCSYCAVPYTRGPENSRPIIDILKEIQNALDKGFKEILLLGQNVNSFQNEKNPLFPRIRPFMHGLQKLIIHCFVLINIPREVKYWTIE